MNIVTLIAVTKNEASKPYRLIEFALPAFNKEGNNTASIYARYWTDNPMNIFASLEAGRKIAIKGHLDFEQEFGTIVVVESFETLK